MKISLSIVIIALILNFSIFNSKKLEKSQKNKHADKTNTVKDFQKERNLLSTERKYYRETEFAAENFLFEISHLVLHDFKILRRQNITGITYEVLKEMIHADKDFGNNITNEELKKKFQEYDVTGKGYLDKITYSGILSEFMLAKAALKKLNKYFDDSANVELIVNEPVAQDFNKTHLENHNLTHSNHTHDHENSHNKTQEISKIDHQKNSTEPHHEKPHEEHHEKSHEAHQEKIKPRRLTEIKTEKVKIVSSEKIIEKKNIQPKYESVQYITPIIKKRIN